MADDMKCIRYTLFLFNLIFFLAGLALIITGAVVLTKRGDYLTFMGVSWSALVVLFIIVGCIIFIIGSFGFCGTFKENYCMIWIFAILLLIIFIFEIAAVVAAKLAKDKVSEIISEELQESISKYDSDEDYKHAWDVMQSDLECCGIHGSDDWLNKRGTVPDSCPDEWWNNLYTGGCINSLTALAKKILSDIICVGISVAGFQVAILFNKPLRSLLSEGVA